MKRKKCILIVVLCILFAFFVLREFGIVDLHLYMSSFSSSHTSTKSQLNSGDEKHFSYNVSVKHRSETIGSYSHSYNNLPFIEIEAILDEPAYSGNYFLPLFKNIQMKYVCNFSTKKSEGGSDISGKIEGNINGKISGICSYKKARELAYNEAKKQIMTYLKKLNGP